MNRSPVPRAACAAVLLLAVAFAPGTVPRADAATITVNRTADTSGDPTICTLRDAITAANGNAAAGGCTAGDPGLDIINFSFPRLTCLISPCKVELGTPLPTVTEDLTVDGGFYFPTIGRVAVAKFPVFNLGAVAVDMRNVVITGGSIQGAGGGILMAGGSLSVTNVTFSSNKASSRGGAIFVPIGAALNVANCGFGANTGGEGGAIGCYGGTTSVSGSRFSGNSAAGDGGAIHAEKPTGAPACQLTVVASTFDGNTAANGLGAIIPPSTGSGGAIASLYANVTIVDSTFSNNHALGTFGGGGGIALASIGSSAGFATLANVTVSGNDTKGKGGGINIDGNTHINNLTITNNTAVQNTGGIFQAGFGFDPIKVQNSIIAANFGSATAGPDCAGTFTSQGYNVVGSGDGCTGFSGAAGDDVGGGTRLIDPLLGPLADNGGPTQTHALLLGSPAIDTGNPQPPKRDVACFETDQRGVVRPIDGDGDGTATCDAGAYEAPGISPGASTTTTSTTLESSSTTSTTAPVPVPVPCILSQLPQDSLAGVECALGLVRSTLDGPPEATCTCKRCSLEPRLDRLTDLLTQADGASSARKCKRKLRKARRAAKSLHARVGSLAGRACIAPADRATSLDAQTGDLASRIRAVLKSPFCSSE